MPADRVPFSLIHVVGSFVDMDFLSSARTRLAGCQAKSVEIERSGTGIGWVVKNEIKYKGILDSFNSLVMVLGDGCWLNTNIQTELLQSSPTPAICNLNTRDTCHLQESGKC